MNTAKKTLAALASEFRCHVCFHDYDGRIVAGTGPQPLYHCNPACGRVWRVKKGFLLCCDMEAKESRTRLMAVRQPFFKCCHAGLYELVTPVFHGEILTGAMFVGPFRAVEVPADAGALLRQNRSEFARKIEGPFYDALPALNRREAENLLVFAELTALRVAMTFTPDHELTAESPHEVKIRYFIDREFRHDIYLADLGKFIGVGEIRVCQLLRQHFGVTFSALLNARRLEHACYLLKDSMLKTSAVAGECGFADVSYFFRVFRRQFGMTPGEYRRRIQPETVSASNLLA